MKIPWPKGLTPAQIQERQKEQKEWLLQYKEELRQEFESAIANSDIPKLVVLWRAAIELASIQSTGPSFTDIEEMSQLMLALATAAEERGKPNQNMLVMRSVLSEFNGARTHARPSFGLERGMTQLRQGVSIEVDGLLIPSVHEARKAAGGSEEQPNPDSGPSDAAATKRADEGAARHAETLTAHEAVANERLRAQQKQAETDPEEDPADKVQLVGWAEILPALGYEPKDRAVRDRIKKLNKCTTGPIIVDGRKPAIANRGRLIAWWKKVDKLAADQADRRSTEDKAQRQQDSFLANPGVRKELGFHDRANPNKGKKDH